MKRLTAVIIMLLMAFGAKAARCETDTLSSFVMFPRGASGISQNDGFQAQMEELFKALEQPGCTLLQVVVEGSASPDGLWGNNVALSKARTDAAASYLRTVMRVPAHKIRKHDLMEGWDKLEEMVERSDIPCKAEALDIIRTKDWGERKTALKNLGDGCVWALMEDHFFPKLRGVTVSLICTGYEYKEVTSCQKVEIRTVRDTVYLRDTVYIVRESEHVSQAGVQAVQEAPECPEEECESSMMMGLKTNLLSDAVAVPAFGMEFQLARHISLDLQAWAAGWNVFVPGCDETTIYGVSPELRWWFGDGIMRQGSFVGVHGNATWYDVEWKDGRLYQDGPGQVWSAGLTYGYSLGMGKKKLWGLEFVVGAGYMSVSQDVAERNAQCSWQLAEHQNIKGFGITKAGVNLTYRFPLRRNEPEVKFAF